jgi:hypothetical protein
MSEYQYPNADIAELLALLNATEGVEEKRRNLEAVGVPASGERPDAS